MKTEEVVVDGKIYLKIKDGKYTIWVLKAAEEFLNKFFETPRGPALESYKMYFIDND